MFPLLWRISRACDVPEKLKLAECKKLIVKLIKLFQYVCHLGFPVYGAMSFFLTFLLLRSPVLASFLTWQSLHLVDLAAAACYEVLFSSHRDFL